jgi:hypothetical protein
MSNELAKDVNAFFQTYCAAFEALDVEAIADCVAYPSHIVSDGDEVGLIAIANRQECLRTMDRVVELHRQLGGPSGRVHDLSILELSPAPRAGISANGCPGSGIEPPLRFPGELQPRKIVRCVAHRRDLTQPDPPVVEMHRAASTGCRVARNFRCEFATVPDDLIPDKRNAHCGHEPCSQRRETSRGTTMRAQRVWNVNGAAGIGQLQSRLDDLNKRLSQLESQHPESWKIEELKSIALSLSREIDDIRCAEATAALRELLRK